MKKTLMKLISVADQDSFSQRLNEFLASLDELELSVVEIQFSTTVNHGGQVVYSALIRYHEGKDAGAAKW